MPQLPVELLQPALIEQAIKIQQIKSDSVSTQCGAAVILRELKESNRLA